MSAASQLGQLPVAGTEANSSEAHAAAGPDRLRTWVFTFVKVFMGTATWLFQKAKAQQARKGLRVCENVSLGERRFVAVVQVDRERFLIGGSSSSVSMLARLQEAATFAETLQRSQETGKTS